MSALFAFLFTVYAAGVAGSFAVRLGIRDNRADVTPTAEAILIESLKWPYRAYVWTAARVRGGRVD